MVALYHSLKVERVKFALLSGLHLLGVGVGKPSPPAVPSSPLDDIKREMPSWLTTGELSFNILNVFNSSSFATHDLTRVMRTGSFVRENRISYYVTKVARRGSSRKSVKTGNG
jgi:hypothetical protein